MRLLKPFQKNFWKNFWHQKVEKTASKSSILKQKFRRFKYIGKVGDLGSRGRKFEKLLTSFIDDPIPTNQPVIPEYLCSMDSFSQRIFKVKTWWSDHFPLWNKKSFLESQASKSTKYYWSKHTGSTNTMVHSDQILSGDNWRFCTLECANFWWISTSSSHFLFRCDSVMLLFSFSHIDFYRLRKSS